VLVLVATIGTGTAGAQEPSPSTDGYLGVNAPLTTCVVNATQVPTGSDREVYWRKVANWLNPFGNFTIPSDDALFLTLQCAFAPAAATALAENPQVLDRIGVSFANDGATAPGEFIECSRTGYDSGVDWFPTMNGAQVRLGCTARWNDMTTWRPLSTVLSLTDNLSCMVGVELQLGNGSFIRSFTHKATGGVPASWGNATGSWSGPESLFPPYTGLADDCNPTGYYTGGVVPPDWPAGDVPEWADVTGCNGLTVRSEDNTEAAFEPGDEVPMYLAPIDPAREPGAVDVAIRTAEGRPRGEPVRWEAFARWPVEPEFTFVVGDDIDQGDWVFRLTCSDGTSKSVYYDPTGEGGNRRVDDLDMSFDIDECFADAPELGLEPSSWVPGLVGRIKCLFSWSISMSRPPGYHLARMQNAVEGTGLGDAALIATAPYRTLGALSSGATPQTSIETGIGTVTLPSVDSLTADRIRLALSVLLGLVAIRASVGMWSRAANSKVADE
jgi:hypothetical protein